MFSDDDDRQSYYTSSKDAKIDFGFGGNPMERAARKYGFMKQKRSPRSGAANSQLLREQEK